MRIILNPKYKHLRSYLTDIEHHFDHEGHEIYRGRDVVRTLQVAGLTLWVKRYASPGAITRMSWRFFRSPQAKRAYVRPLQMRERGIMSPEPVAFVKVSKGLFNSATYFVALQSTYRYTMADLPSLPDDEQQEVIARFASFSAKVHEQGFLHRNFSSTNILFDRVNNRIVFALIDTTSMSCGRPVSVRKGCSNFARLQGDEAFFDALGVAYAEARGADAETCVAAIKAARGRYLRRATQSAKTAKQS